MANCIAKITTNINLRIGCLLIIVMTITPLEQFSNPVLYLPVPLLSIGITKLTLYGIFILIIITGLFVLPFLHNNLILSGTRWSITIETMYSSIGSILNDQVGEGYSEYIPATISLFVFIFSANYLSNVPYSYGFTTSVIVCLGLSVTIFIGVTIIGLTTHKITWFSFFVPSGTPLALVPLLVLIEFISYIARAFSLGIRLFANLVSGHILLAVLSTMIWTIMTSGILYFLLGLIPFSIFTALFVLELAVSFIQSFVFTLLFASYLNDAINLH